MFKGFVKSRRRLEQKGTVRPATTTIEVKDIKDTTKAVKKKTSKKEGDLDNNVSEN
jgi:hypothetical protein